MPSLILSMGARELQRYPITRVHTLIGRAPICDIRIDNPAVSRLHARLEYRGDKFVLVDVSSANGILFRGQRVPEIGLHSGVEVDIGKFTLKLVDDGGLAPQRLEPGLPQLSSADHDSGTTVLDQESIADLGTRLRQRHRTETIPMYTVPPRTQRSHVPLLLAVLGACLGLLAIYFIVG